MIGIVKSRISPETKRESPVLSSESSRFTTNESANAGVNTNADIAVKTNIIPTVYLNTLEKPKIF